MNKTGNYDFTIIVPVFNEKDSLDALSKRLKEYLPLCPMRACVLIVNDGSSDGSTEMIRNICANNKDFFYIEFRQHVGLTAAFKAGFEQCYSRYCGIIDADLQTVPEDFNLLLEHIPEFSMVIGARTDRKDTWFKKVQSKIANRFYRLITGDTESMDTCCPLKVFETSVARRFPMFKSMHRFFPALVLLQEGCRYKQLPVRHFPRVSGQSKFNMTNRFVTGLRACFAYHWMKSNNLHFEIGSSDL